MACHPPVSRARRKSVGAGRQTVYASAYKNSQGWHLREPEQAFARTLFLNDYQETPGSTQLTFTANEDFSFLRLPAFAWTRAWSATVRLSDENLYPREGSAGTLDARLDTLAWGVSSKRKLAAPLIELDHLQNHFAGGRWIFMPAELPVHSGRALLRSLFRSLPRKL